MSVYYYSRLEQGRSRSASPEVLDALGDALQLDDAGKDHLLVLAHHTLARRLITDFRSRPAGKRNQARFVFLDAHARELYSDWASVAADTVAMLRLDAGRHPDDPHLETLVGELSIRSEVSGATGRLAGCTGAPPGPRAITTRRWGRSP